MIARIAHAGSALILCLACGCAGPLERRVSSAVEAGDATAAVEAYGEYRAADGDDSRLLARVAGALLMAAARGEDDAARDAALNGMAMAGSAGEDLLEELAEDADRPVARARALAVLAARGDGGARSALRSLLGAEDTTVQAAAVAVLDPEDERDRLLESLGHPAADVRQAAAEALARARPRDGVRRALARVARNDPEPRVRATAVHALAGQGPDAFAVLRDRLTDPSTLVRMAVVRSLVRADPSRGARSVAGLLATPPSPAGIEAARMIRLRSHRDPSLPSALVEDAGAYLVGALRAGTGRLRSQAAVALVSLPSSPAFDRALIAALGEETDPEVRLQLARARLRRAEVAPRAVSALEVIAEGRGMAAVQAAALLAERGNPRAAARLARELEQGEPVVRSAAARALACEASSPGAAFAALDDPKALVRVHAAAAILRCI